MSNKALSCWLLSRHCDEHIWVFLKCCGLCLLHVWSEAKYVCYEKRAFGTPDRNELNELQSSSQIVSRAGADANLPLLLSIPMWVFLNCCSLCLLHVWSEATHKAIYRISLLIITHHYSSLRNSLLIITQIALLIITHHYTTSDGWKNHCVVWRFDATKLCILGHYAWKSRGGLAPPSIFVRNDE